MSNIAELVTVDGTAAAIDRGELHVAYQPIVHLTSGGVVGAEALVRWTHPLLGALAPADFIPPAEASGSIVAIGRFVLDTALTAASAWPRSGDGAAAYITVNVSGRELDEPDYAAYVIATMASLGLRASDLRLEVIESFFDAAAPSVLANLSELQEHGVVIVVDDFGSGYSDDARREGIGASVIKIDRSLTATVTGPTDTPETAHLAAILADAASRSIDVIAEGIETVDQAGWYADHGCSAAQGFFFAEAMSDDNIAKLIENGGHWRA